MSKIIAFLAIFIGITGVLTAIFFLNVPKSLQIIKAQVIETGKNSGFDIEIRESKITFPNTIEFGGISVVNSAQNLELRINSCRFDISFADYIASVFNRITRGRSIYMRNFSQRGILEGIELEADGKKIFSEGEGSLFFENEDPRFEITTQNFADLGVEVQKITLSGLIDNAVCIISSKLFTLGGEINLNAVLDFHNFTLKNVKLEARGLELAKIAPDFNVSGTLFAEIIPKPEEFALNADFLKNFKEAEASASVSVLNFKDEGSRFARQILSALAIVGINSLDFAKISANFEYSPPKIAVNDLVADNFRFSVLADGHFTPKTLEYDFRAGIRFSPVMRSSVERNIWEAMTPDIPQNEGRFLGATILGKGENLSVSLDEQVFRRGINSLLSSLRDIFR